MAPPPLLLLPPLPPLSAGNLPRSSASASAGLVSLLGSAGLASSSSLIFAFFFFFFLVKSIAVSSSIRSFLSVSLVGAAICPLRAVVGIVESVLMATQWETAAIMAAEATAGQPAFCGRFTYVLRLSAHGERLCPGRHCTEHGQQRAKTRRLSKLSPLLSRGEIVTAFVHAAADPQPSPCCEVLRDAQTSTLAVASFPPA